MYDLSVCSPYSNECEYLTEGDTKSYTFAFEIPILTGEYGVDGADEIEMNTELFADVGEVSNLGEPVSEGIVKTGFNFKVGATIEEHFSE